MQYGSEEHAQEFLTNDVAVICDDELAFVAACQVGEDRNRIRKMDMNNIGFAFANRVEQARADGCGCKIEKRSHARYVYSVNCLTQTLAVIVGDDHLEIDAPF